MENELLYDFKHQKRVLEVLARLKKPFNTVEVMKELGDRYGYGNNDYMQISESMIKDKLISEKQHITRFGLEINFIVSHTNYTSIVEVANTSGVPINVENIQKISDYFIKNASNKYFS